MTERREFIGQNQSLYMCHHLSKTHETTANTQCSSEDTVLDCMFAKPEEDIGRPFLEP